MERANSIAATEEQIAQLEDTIAHLESQRSVLGDAAVEVALAALRQQLSHLCQATTAGLKPSLEGERKLVTIMFADISGFTALAETMDPEAVRDLMNACFEQLVPLVEKYGGTVDKFIGDEIMALFGAPVAHENDPERALHAALEMMDALTEFNAEQSTDLGLHFGINTGLVIAGGLGTRERQEYSVMGDAVNLASRLEAASERGEIFVGPNTYRLTAPLFEFEPLEPIRVKGKADPVPLYGLLAAKAVRGKVRGIDGLDSPVVGRETEFQALCDAIERLQAGVGGIVTLVGEAGLGKSRLVAEIRRSAVTASDPIQWVEGSCLSYGGSIAYLLWLDILRGLVGTAPDDNPVTASDLLREQIQELCPSHFGDVFPYLARMMSLPLDSEAETTIRGLESELLRSGTFTAIETVLEVAARQRPLIVICEDLHWADPTSIELLEKLLPLTDRVPLLFVCIFRPETEHDCWRIKETAARLYRHRYTDLRLDPLTAAESEELVGNLLQAENLPQELWERILDHAEGNPFYVEELLRSLIDSKAIAQGDTSGRWQTTRKLADITIPDTLHGVLMARIDRLQDKTKRVLQLASVIGRTFFYRVLAEIASEKYELDLQLLTLQREEMISERARVPELEYIFKHHLTQETAYNSLLQKERCVYHRQVAEALEQLFPEQIEEQVGLLAHHWERAEEPDKATEYLLRAGDQARLAYAHYEAIDCYQRALIFLKKLKEHTRAARTLMKLGLTYHNAFDFQQTRQAYEAGFAMWQQAGRVPSATSSSLLHTLRVVEDEPTTLDPTLNTDHSGLIIDQLFSGLVEHNSEMEILPDVAQSWQVSERGRKYVFHLRDDVRWGDGVPVTAGDFEYAFKRILDPATRSLNAPILYDTKGASDFNKGTGQKEDVGVRAIDEFTLIVELEEPTGYFLNMLAFSSCFPVPRHKVETHGETWAKVDRIVTNGPFVLETWQPGHSMVFSRNPAYHGGIQGNLKQVEVVFHKELATRLGMYEADRLDVLPIQSSEVDRIRQRYADDYVSSSLLRTMYVGFNVARPPFDDPQVRRALVLATDRESFANVVAKGCDFPATGGFVPPGMPGHSAEIGLPYDPEQAHRLLIASGFSQVRDLTILGTDLVIRGRHTPHTEYLRAQWQENLGIATHWETVTIDEFINTPENERPHLCLLGWSADCPDPDNFLRVAAEDLKLATRWRNKTYDELVEKARRVTDQNKRIELYRQADSLLIEQAVILPLTYRRAHQLIKPWVSSFPITAIGGRFWKDIVIEPH